MTTNVHAAIAPTGTRGQLIHSLVDGDSSTYCASMIGIACFFGDIFQIQGIANGVVRIVRIDIAMTATAAAQALVSIQRRQGSNSGGGQSGINNTKNDSGNPTNQSSPTFFTSAPSPGVPVGTPRTYSVPITVPAAASVPLFLDYGTGPRQSLLLRGTSDFMCITLAGGVGGAGNVATINVEWTESAS